MTERQTYITLTQVVHVIKLFLLNLSHNLRTFSQNSRQGSNLHTKKFITLTPDDGHGRVDGPQPRRHSRQNRNCQSSRQSPASIDQPPGANVLKLFTAVIY